MRRIILMAIMLAVTVAGCNRFPDLTIQVTANLAPDDSDCGVQANQEEVVAVGLYDLAITRDYFLTPRIESFLVDNSLEIQGQQGNIQITSFEVTIKLPDNTTPDLGESLPNPYQVTTSAVIEPADSPDSVPTVGAAFATVIPSSYKPALDAIANDSGFDSIVLEIRANGTTSGGFSQQSPPFNWPVGFCFGCLGTTCEPPAEIGDAVGCFPGQDNWQYCAQIVDPEAAP